MKKSVIRVLAFIFVPIVVIAFVWVAAKAYKKYSKKRRIAMLDKVVSLCGLDKEQVEKLEDKELKELIKNNCV